MGYCDFPYCVINNTQHTHIQVTMDAPPPPLPNDPPQPLTSHAIESWKNLFYEIIDKNLKPGGNLMTKKKYDDILTVLKAKRAGVDCEMRHELKSRFSQYDAWRRDYRIFDFGGGEVLVHTPPVGDDGIVPALDQSQRVSYYERLFDDLRGMHQVENQTHPKAHTLYGNVKKKYGKSIP